MRISINIEADYEDLHDKDALTREQLEANLKLIALRIATDYKNHNSQEKKGGGLVFYYYTI